MKTIAKRPHNQVPRSIRLLITSTLLVLIGAVTVFLANLHTTAINSLHLVGFTIWLAAIAGFLKAGDKQ